LIQTTFLSNGQVQYSGLSLLQCLLFRNTAYYDIKSVY
jgi:hypothetical protein